MKSIGYPGAMVVLASCGLFDAEPPALTLDSSAYMARITTRGATFNFHEFDVVATYSNRTSQTIYLANCRPTSSSPIFYVVPADHAESAWGTGWACVGHDQQLAVAPGAQRVDTITLTSPNALSGGLPTGSFEGMVKLKYEPQSCRGDGQCRIDNDRLKSSNTFRIRVPE